MDNKSFASINQTRKGFEESFKSGDFYNKQTQDKKHLMLIMNYLKINEGMKILDLGTGTGYLAFPLAEKYPKVSITGLDIVEKALQKNDEKAKAKGLNNLQFINYDGVTFPFKDKSFDLVITRYALHHFPQINETFKEIKRVLTSEGKLFLVDPAPNENDTERFVDAYMQMKKDGHIKFYTKDEWQKVGEKADLFIEDSFETSIRFPKKRDTALEFKDIINRFDNEVIKGYEVEIIDDEIWIREKVNNILFKKLK